MQALRVGVLGVAGPDSTLMRPRCADDRLLGALGSQAEVVRNE